MVFPPNRAERLHCQALQPALLTKIKQWQELQVPRGSLQQPAPIGGSEVRLPTWLSDEEHHLHKGR